MGRSRRRSLPEDDARDEASSGDVCGCCSCARGKHAEAGCSCGRLAHEAEPLKTTIARLVEKLPGCRVIWADDGTPYLLRVYLVRIFRRRLPGVFLHYFFQGDRARATHNHPWREAASIILTGGYVEERRMPDGGTRTETFFPGDLNIIAGDTFHRVDLIRDGCWSLFIAGKRTKGWGFSERPGHFETWRERDARLAQESRE